jgi:hypothetical protein
MIQFLARYPMLVSPFTLSAVAAVTALVASLLLDAQDASAGIIVHTGPRGGR